MATSDENQKKLEQQIDKLTDKVEMKFDRIADRLTSIDTTLAAQHESLKDHIRRTEILENEVKPIKTHVDGLTGAIKFVKIVGILAAIAEALHLFKIL